jgi:type II secretory pathway pseudopilin PulG
MIVVAIIAVIAAIAIPSLLGAKKSANEASAISSLRTISTVCEQFRNRNGTYPATLAALGAAGLIDAQLATGAKSGYNFSDPGGTASTWSVTATPTTAGTTGDRDFRCNQTGVLEESATGAGAWSPIQ